MDGLSFRHWRTVRLTTPEGKVGGATAAKSRNSLFVMRGKQVLKLAVRTEPGTHPLRTPSRVFATEQVICTLSEHLSRATALHAGAWSEGGTPAQYAKVNW